MRTAQDKFKDLLEQRIAPWMKDRGFKRRDTTFRRRGDETWEIVNFQGSKWSDAGEVRFTINLGVSHDVLCQDASWAKRGWPLEYECDFRQRIGQLYKGEDHWWRLHRLRPVGPVANDVLQALERAALPWLECHSDARGYLAEAVQDPSRVTAFNLGSLVRLASAIGTDREVRVAEAELAAWQRGDRSGW